MITFKINQNEDIYLSPLKISEEGAKEIIYELIDKSHKSWMKLQLVESQLQILSKNKAIIDPPILIREKLDELILEIIENVQSGMDQTELNDSNTIPYKPEEIKVSTRQFSLPLIEAMIKRADIDLTPGFQRNFVWTPLQKSRLIESILLRIPLPMFYFAENEEGLITVVDGLQRLTTIQQFMNNEFSLKGLQYLTNCEHKYYTHKDKTKAIDAKYFRWFNSTQLMVNVIEASSPAKVKYDIFERINTGGKPLNHQEIRNCLALDKVRVLLHEMTTSALFKKATDNSVRSLRMEDTEMALRFICFHRLYKEDSTLDKYNGNMKDSLNELVELLGKPSQNDLNKYVFLFSNAMKNAEHLFGTYAFRKILPKHLAPTAHKQLINKALFVSLAVLLSPYDPEQIVQMNHAKLLAAPLATLIQTDDILRGYLSYGTNGKANMQAVFVAMNQLIKNNINL